MAPFSPQVLSEHGYGQITTDIREGQAFYYAEDYHQQYLSKTPDGYCGLGGTGVSCPLDTPPKFFSAKDWAATANHPDLVF
ncbi:Peptide methionine sulfoxide reductase [Pteropus alecto]|uniref:peptide-methionine (S)-S-oxide reductase n=1 Tax=Pteropus alecto TaxID=9402 RepID=L5L369_PTEAL|nr:Peptide methionine sulfoxide reductase [Pteropus alecto]